MTQAEAIELMHSGANVFLTGEPGAGKTYTLNKFIEEAQEKHKRIAITASTGIAASHIGGTTIHSWSGLGIADAISDAELDRMGYKQQLVERYNRCDILIIDEISMLHGSRLDMVDRACRWIRRKEDVPFGGLQVIFVGDMFQLPPVTRGSDETDFAHHSNAWRVAELKPAYLTEQHRQGAGDELLDILREMRREGRVSQAAKQVLDSRVQSAPDDSITKLYTHNVDVDSLNNRKLSELDGPARTYTMTGKGKDWLVDKLMKNLLCPDKLQLKVGAEVMFVANDFDAGFVNGTRGQVVAFEGGDPVVETTDGMRIQVEQHTWRQFNETGEYVVAEVSQHPLRLAWAVTIHKSQGMSLDAAEIDLSRAFVPGMGYVALSRVRSLDGLFLVGLGPQALQLDSDIYKFDKALKLGRS